RRVLLRAAAAPPQSARPGRRRRSRSSGEYRARSDSTSGSLRVGFASVRVGFWSVQGGFKSVRWVLRTLTLLDGPARDPLHRPASDPLHRPSITTIAPAVGGIAQTRVSTI